METTYIFGHKSPDTDAINSALIMAEFERLNGNESAKAYRLGEVGAETQYALDHFKAEAPELLSDDLTGKNVILVDHNEFQQSADSIEGATILHVLDHHRIANFHTAGPLCYRAEPLGCTATILYKMFNEKGFDIKPQIAGLMLSAIISDSLLFKSPTCTQQDKDATQALAKIADVDPQEYGLEMLKAGASTVNKSAVEIINADAKSFNMGDYTVRIGQVNTVDLNEILGRQAELEKAITETLSNADYDIFVLVATDILNSDSTILVLGKDKERIAKAFNVELDNNTAFLPGVVSRKKQIVPPITNELS